MLLSFVILTWNSEKYIAECLRSIIQQCKNENLRFNIHVTDNGSTDHTVNILKNFADHAANSTYIHLLDRNRGTTYSRNLALKATHGSHVCILDSDTILVSGSIAEVLNYLDQHLDVGIVAPKLILPDGSVQHSAKKFPTFVHKMAKAGAILRGLQPHTDDFYPTFPFSRDTSVDTAISACWIFRQSILREVGYLDENIFYSPEDLDYCVRIWQSGKKVIFFPRLVLLHNTQQISHQTPLSFVSLSHLAGLIYYFTKHGGWFSNNTLYRRIGLFN